MVIKNGKSPARKRQTVAASSSSVKSQSNAVPKNFGEQELCNQLMDGSICARELAQDSPMRELNCGDAPPISSANGTVTADEFLQQDSPESIKSTTSKNATLTSVAKSNSLPQALPANPSQLTASDSELTMNEIVSPQFLQQSGNSDHNSQSLKMSLGYSPAQNNQEQSNYTSLKSLSIFPRAGTYANGNVSEVPHFKHPGCEHDSLLLRSPGALSGGESSRPPGKTRLETQLNQLGLIQDGEVAAPEFLEAGYNLPLGWTNSKENRTAIELAQVQAQPSLIDPRSELPAEMETTAIEGNRSEMPLTGESLLSDSNELIISLNLPQNIGALEKAELISMAIEQHQLICIIDRKEFELALEKLHRVRLTGVYLQEFKKKCQYGEFQDQLRKAGIGERSAQCYMTIAKNWDIVEAKAKLVALLAEENQQPAIGLKWALEAVREEKKALKSAAPPSDPDCWRTPNTREQPIVDLIKKALGGQIWCDPCADAGHKIGAAVAFHKNDDGLKAINIWRKTVFVNPPFSDPLPWVDKCCVSIARGDCSQAIMLLKAGTLSNQGTGELINKYASGICHWRGRIYFLNDNGIAVKGSDFDCVMVYFGDRFDRFRETFETFGTVSFIENHYSSVNKRLVPTAKSVIKESKQLAAAVGLGNGRSGVMPDMRDRDRELAERHDPHTVVDVLSMPPSMPPAPVPVSISKNLFQPLGKPEIFDETSLAIRQFETAKQNTLNDYITAISGNLADFSDEQIAFLAKIINEESAKRIEF